MLGFKLLVLGNPDLVLSFKLLVLWNPDLVLSFKLLVLWNPDLGEAPPRPPVEGQGAAPQTPLHKGRSVGIGSRFALVLNVIDLFVMNR